jgi:hypothetical protein
MSRPSASLRTGYDTENGEELLLFSILFNRRDTTVTTGPRRARRTAPRLSVVTFVYSVVTVVFPSVEKQEFSAVLRPA